MAGNQLHPDTMTRIASWMRAHPRGVLGGALTASLLAHLIIAALPQPSATVPEPLPMLSATLTEMPPPPAPVAKLATPKRKPKPPPAAPVIAAPSNEPAPLIADAVQPEPAPEPAPVVAAAPTEEAVAVAANDASTTPQLPPRIELVYRGFLGTQGFFIGDAVYRLEHSDNQYSITTV